MAYDVRKIMIVPMKNVFRYHCQNSMQIKIVPWGIIWWYRYMMEPINNAYAWYNGLVNKGSRIYVHFNVDIMIIIKVYHGPEVQRNMDF